MARHIGVLGHRTGMACFPENSLTGIEHCRQDGAFGVECDITFVDGEPYVWASGTEEPEPTLHVDELFAYLRKRPGLTVYMDVKFYDRHTLAHFRAIDEDILDMVAERILWPARRAGLMDRIGFVTFCGGAPLLLMAKLFDRRIATDLMAIFPWTNVLKHRAYVDAITIGWDPALGNHWRLFPRSLDRIVREARGLGIRVRGGLANRGRDLHWLSDLGVDDVWTDNVPFAKRYLAVC